MIAIFRTKVDCSVLGDFVYIKYVDIFSVYIYIYHYICHYTCIYTMITCTASTVKPGLLAKG